MFGIPQYAYLLNVPSVWFVNYPDDGSMSQNMLPVLRTDKLCALTKYNNILFHTCIG